MNYIGNLGIRVVVDKKLLVLRFPSNQNLFITICKSKKVKLISISCGVISETDSVLGQIFSPQNNQANTKILPTVFTNNGPLFINKLCFQFKKDFGDMSKICDLTYKVVQS